MAKGAMTRSPKRADGEGKVYAGGPGNFDESKGRYTAPPRGSERLSPGVYRTPSGGLMSGQGRPLPSTGPQVGQQLVNSMFPMKRPAAPSDYMYRPAVNGPFQGFSPQQPQNLSLSQVARMSPEEIRNQIAMRQAPQQPRFTPEQLREMMRNAVPYKG